MNNVFNNLFASVIAFFALNVFAQQAMEIPAVKEGDKLVIKYIVYGEKGRELVEQSTSDLPASVSFFDNGYSVNYKAGRVETYNNQHTLLSFKSRGKVTDYPSEQQFNWFPKDFSVGKKDPVSYSVNNNECPNVKNTFPDVTVEQGVRSLRLQGVEKQVPVQVLTFKGKWSGSCGTGNFETVVVYSQQLNFILERKSLNYLPNGFLYAGEARIVTSLN